MLTSTDDEFKRDFFFIVFIQQGVNVACCVIRSTHSVFVLVDLCYSLKNENLFSQSKSLS